MRKIAFKYGLLIALGLMVWAIIAHMLVPDPTSKIHSLGAMIFINLLQFTGIYLGISAFARELGGALTFKQAMKTGVWISFVYAIAAALFFAVVIFIIGTKWLAGEPGGQRLPMTLVAIQAFTGLFLGTMFFGLIYSTVISFFMAKRQTTQV